MTDDDIKRLREMAERATSGPWKHDIDEMWADGADVTIYSGDNYVVNVSTYPPGSERSVAFDASHANAAYIAAASPDVLLRLLDERDALRETARMALREMERAAPLLEMYPDDYGEAINALRAALEGEHAARDGVGTPT